MKKLLNLLCALVILASSCSREELLENETTASLNDIIFTAGFEQDTRTYIQDGMLLRWNEGDQISIFVGNTLNRQYKFDGETGDNGGTFSVVDAPFGTGNDLACHYAVYPYAAGVKITEKGVVTTALPAEQSYAENSFGLGANTMVAVTKDTDDTFLKFKNVCGYLMLQLYGNNITVKSITLTGNNDEKLAGKATVTPLYGQEPTIAMSDDATTSITLNCGNGVKLGTSAETATAFWIVVPPTTFDEGFEITITDINGGTFTKSTSKEVVIERNIIKPMAAFEVEIKEVIPNNEIWYTSTDGKIVTPYSDYVFGAKLVSNTYENGKGVIKFDAPVTSIGLCAIYVNYEDYAFAECSSLTSITIPDSVTAIGYAAFGGCSSLTSITIPDSVTYIEDYAFAGCSSLTSVTIPDGVIYIGEEAFSFCRSLTSVTIPDNVTSIGDGAFSYCSSLTEFKGKFASNDGRCLIVDGVLNSFAPSGLSEYTIPNSVTSIGQSAFSGCHSLTSVTIPDGVTEIERHAFYNCSSLTSVYCKPTTPPTGGHYMFNTNASGRKIYVPMESVEAYKSAEYWSDYASDIIAYDFEKGEVVEVIPNNEIWYTSTAKVEPYIYYWDFGAKIVSNEWDSTTGKGIITFDEDVTNIGDYAFYGCSSLTSITIPDSVTSIGEWVFASCKNLTSITIPNSVTSIGGYAFGNCTSLTSVTIPDSVTTIGEEAFCDCRSLTSITIPDSVTTIGNWAFGGCSGLTSITIPDSVTSIGDNVFICCMNLAEFKGKWASNDGRSWMTSYTILSYANASGTEYTIPAGVRYIANDAFYGCGSLTSITIPDSVTYIGERAFSDCSSLTSVYCKPTTPPTGDYCMFNTNASGRKIYVPRASVEAYKSAEYWSEYADAIVGYDF